MNTDTQAPWPTMAATELLHPVLVKDDPHTANPRAAVVEYYRAAAVELVDVMPECPTWRELRGDPPFVYGPPAALPVNVGPPAALPVNVGGDGRWGDDLTPWLASGGLVAFWGSDEGGEL